MVYIIASGRKQYKVALLLTDICFIISALTGLLKAGKFMPPKSIGKIRGIQQLANEAGVFNMCAMDHRGSMRSALCEDPDINEEDCDQEMTDLKLELCAKLSPHASAVLLDPIYGAGQCLARGVLAKSSGLLVSIEATGYGGGKEHRVTRLLNNWGVEKIKRMGASAVKILIYYRPDIKELAARQLKLVEEVAKDCQKYDIPFLVEPKSYQIGDEVGNPKKFAAIKESLVIETARQMSALPIDVLKTEFPADLRYRKGEAELLALCQRLGSVCRLPWVILSAGVNYEMFCRQVEIACRAGASGFLGGQAVWKEAAYMSDPSERADFLINIAADRLNELSEITRKYAVPWYQKQGLPASNLAEITPEWHAGY